MSSFRWSFLTACLLISPLAAQSWKAGVADTVITPSEPIWMAGFASRTKPSEGVRRDLHVKALALQDETGKTSVLVTLDLVMVEREMADAITERCRNQYGLSRDRIVLNVSHTHSGPVAGLRLMPLYDLNPQQTGVVRRYTAGLIDKIVATVGSAVHGLQPATLEFRQGLAGIAVNRRRAGHREYPGPVDPDVPVLAVRDTGGNLRAIAVGYACHATSLSDYLINGDWPGYAQEEIEKAHPGAVALFVQGCGADSNPLPRGQVELAQAYGKILAAAVDEVLSRKAPPLSGPLNTAFETVDVPFHHVPSRVELEKWLGDANKYRRLQARYLLQVLEREGRIPDRYPYPVEVWQFGRGLKFIALGGEAVVDYSLRLKARHGWADTWVASYSNDILAYIPSLRVLKEGGYEGGDAMMYFGRPGPFGAAVEEIIVEKVADLVERTNAR